MNFRDIFALAWANLRAHKLRSFLTLLGLVIGVATLITVMTVVQGANLYVQDKIANLGINVFQVSKMPVVVTDFQELMRALHNKNITRDDLAALSERCVNCAGVGAQVSASLRVRYRDKEITDVNVLGQTPNMSYIGTRTVEHGRFFSHIEDQRSEPVCLLGWGLVDKLFPNSDPLDRVVRVGPQELRVVGTMERLGSVLGQDQDNYLIIPLSLFLKMRGTNRSLGLRIKATSDRTFQAAQDEVRLILRGRRHIPPAAKKEDFYIATPDSYMDLWRSISGAFFLVFVMISSISAVIGGIVIMNIMLVSVTERTKEIGVRRACGARRNDILRLFLAEALLSCVLGGLIGVSLGFGAATVLRRLTDFPADVELWVAALGVVFASAIGLFFGIYPASRAARMDPVTALRSE